ncbi:MAG: hypothetical protein DRJ33_08370 [Candidatus Methanomethylicota archaeon]|uniref:Ribbon-helix-helix protein CopG domain-containing protein n=1 Tax=Thermoproteota archaeon TaxID=2056631 RepID=A0A497EPP7_9CREN|nr:MAG: hypothetical protein DRJ33_08370 [Candidatus Verstraetearchaeota archaeon]
MKSPKPINVRLTNKLLNEVDELVKRFSLTRSEIIRQALVFYLSALRSTSQSLISLPKLRLTSPSYARRGDVLLIKRTHGDIIAISCSSSGGIGEKSLDKVKVPGRLLGMCMARLAIMDLMCINAKLLGIALSLSVNPADSREITEGVKVILSKTGIDADRSLLLNAEEVIEVDQTGLGIMAIGEASEDQLKIGASKPGDKLVLVGKPCSGELALRAIEAGRAVELWEVERLLTLEIVHEVIPVDSKGVEHEALTLAYTSGRRLRFYENINADLRCSGGPATAVLLTVDPQGVGEIKKLTSKPVEVIGELT